MSINDRQSAFVDRHRCSVAPSLALRQLDITQLRLAMDSTINYTLPWIRLVVFLFSAHVHARTARTRMHACMAQLALYDFLISVAKLSHESAPAAKIAAQRIRDRFRSFTTSLTHILSRATPLVPYHIPCMQSYIQSARSRRNVDGKLFRQVQPRYFSYFHIIWDETFNIDKKLPMTHYFFLLINFYMVSLLKSTK